MRRVGGPIRVISLNTIGTRVRVAQNFSHGATSAGITERRAAEIGQIHPESIVNALDCAADR